MWPGADALIKKKKKKKYTCTTSHLGMELRISRGNSEYCTRTHNACCNDCVGLIEKVAFVCAAVAHSCVRVNMCD